jgi:hypothetical protein
MHGNRETVAFPFMSWFQAIFATAATTTTTTTTTNIVKP